MGFWYYNELREIGNEKRGTPQHEGKIVEVWDYLHSLIGQASGSDAVDPINTASASTENRDWWFVESERDEASKLGVLRFSTKNHKPDKETVLFLSAKFGVDFSATIHPEDEECIDTDQLKEDEPELFAKIQKQLKNNNGMKQG